MTQRLQAGVFLGRVQQCGASRNVRLIESLYQRGFSTGAHSHELPHFCLVIEGGYRETLRHDEHERTRGTLIYYPADEMHAERHDHDGRHLMIEVAMPWLERIAPEQRWPSAPCAVNEGPMVAIAARMRREMTGQDGVSALMIEALALELMVETLRLTGRTATERAPHRTPRWLTHVLDILHARFAEPPSLGELAREAAIHPAHLTRVFRQHVHHSVGDYVRALRVAEAIRRITTTEEPLITIALACGFADQSHMTRLVKLETGLTPGELRRAPAGSH